MKSPEKASPLAECRADSANQPSGSSGSEPLRWIRSRRSTSRLSPVNPWVPSRERERPTRYMNTMTVASASGLRKNGSLGRGKRIDRMRMTAAIGVNTTRSRGTVRNSPARTMIGAKAAAGTRSGLASTTTDTTAVAASRRTNWTMSDSRRVG